MRKVLYVFVTILLVFLVYGCAFKSDAVRFKKEYESYNGKSINDSLKYPTVDIDKDNPMYYATADEILKVLEDGSGVIYFGYADCPWCRSAVPALLSAAKETSLSKIYYMNVKDERDLLSVDKNGNVVAEKTGTTGYRKLLEALDSILDDYIIEDSDGNSVNTNEKRIYVPLVVFVKDGKIVGHHLDTISSQVNPFDGLNEDEFEQLEKIYTDYIYKVITNVCDEKC